MRIVDKHIGKSVVLATLLVLLILFGLELFISFMGELRDIGTGNYHVWQAFQFAMLSLPISLYALFPMIGLLGCLLGLGYLASHNELIVMRASGVSILQIIFSVLRTVFVMLLLVMLIGGFIAPASLHVAQNLKSTAESGGKILNSMQGVWMRDDDTFVHINKVLPDRYLQGISEYRFDAQHKLLSARYAETANYQNNQWWLHHVAVTTFSQSGSVSSDRLAKQAWSVHVDPVLLNISKIDTDEISFPMLIKLIQYRRTNGLSVAPYELKFWERLFQPVATLVMIFLAIPFIFGPLRAVPMGLRIVTGIIIGFAFYLLNQVFGPLSLVYQIPPIVGVFLPSAVFLLLGCFLMRRLRKFGV